jgi:uncharacterized membrane protein
MLSSSIAPPSDSPAEDSPLAAWRLVRHCAVSPRTYLRHVAAICSFLAMIALGFFALGSPVVALCCVLQACAVAALHLLYAAHVTDGEQVELYPDRLVVVSFVGLSSQVHVFPTCWAQVETGRGRDDGAYWIRHGARRLRLGRHLPPLQRRRTVAAIAQALQGRRPR